LKRLDASTFPLAPGKTVAEGAPVVTTLPLTSLVPLIIHKEEQLVATDRPPNVPPNWFSLEIILGPTVDGLKKLRRHQVPYS